MEQTLQLRAERFTRVDAAPSPRAAFCRWRERLWFRRPKALKLDQEDHLLAPQGELTTIFVLDPGKRCPAAQLVCEETGRVLTVYTDCPGVQVYTANFLEARGRAAESMARGSGVCLETQFYPDSPNHPGWPSPLVKAGERKESVTEFVFGIC